MTLQHFLADNLSLTGAGQCFIELIVGVVLVLLVLLEFEHFFPSSQIGQINRKE